MDAYFDIGGTHFRYLLESEGNEIKRGDIKSAEVSLFGFLESLIKEHIDIKRIGVSFAGQVHDGSIISAPNIEIQEGNIREYFSGRYGIELKIENDLKCAALAESSYFGDPCMMVVMYAGTGLGGAIVQNGKLIAGSSNLAGEIGHIPFKEAPFACGCGKNDCVELYASGSGLLKWANHYSLNMQQITLDALKNLNTPDSLKIIQNFHDALIHAASTAVTLLNPEVLVLGGGIVEANPYLVESVKNGIQKKGMERQAALVQVYKSSIKDAGILGAKLLFARDGKSEASKEMYDLFNDQIEEFVSKEVASRLSCERRVSELEKKHKAQEEIMIEQSKMAAMGEMLGLIAHQWKQPLNALNLMMVELSDLYEFNELNQHTLNTLLESMHKNISFMNHTVEDFRSFFKTNKRIMSFGVVESIDDVYNLFLKAFAKDGVVVVIDGDRGLQIEGYPNEFKQVMLNILTNAKDAIMEKRDDGGLIECIVKECDNAVEIRIKDNGGGIPKEYLPEKIFEKRFSSKGEKGTGLGLYISKIIIEENLKGKIYAKNVDGGAEFVIIVPRSNV